MHAPVPSDLIDAARRGGAGDVEELLAAVWPDAYRLAKAMVAQPQCAEDVAQEACVIILRSIASLRSSDAFRTWFYRIVVREALKQKKLQADRTTVSPDAAYTEDRSALVDLYRALDTLPDSLRVVVVLHYFEDLSSREIGRVLHIPDVTVRVRLTSARRRLRPLLAEYESSTHPKAEELYAL
jgi:RNA polymerase sigma-70 factor (ECF subfamily)